ncbi:hypothetical protein L3Y34_009784 [Caenorhabditis briggsae]|uniref:Neurotransmitter-gated ion-channel ligand-binding domain-containing protein n=1 Tax=Caenorhabditis briggsae TaxID=6238 RepID=A0AAE9A3G5_CAEBR|nr:hypothetical protein L3Y34_009784 [Caenorhabditis briggsae]
MKKRRYSCVRLNPHSSLFLFLRLSIFIFLTSSTSSTTLQNELRRRQSHQVEEDDLSPYHHQSTPSQNHRTPYPEQPEDPIVPTSSRGPKPSESVKIEEEKTEEELLPMERLKRAFGRNDYLLPENFKTLRRADIPVTYRLHDDLLRYYRKGTRPVTHPKKVISVSMSVFLYQIVKLDAVKNTISLSGSFELF